MKKGYSKIFRWIGNFIGTYIIGTLLFIALFHTPILNGLNVLMYRGIILLMISCFFVMSVLFALRKIFLKTLEIKDVLLMCLTYCCINIVLFTLIPVTVERSISVFMLSYMSDHNEIAYTENEIKEVFIQYYVDEYGAFTKRFDEQDITGTIEQTKEGYKITEKGELLVSMFRTIAKLFNTDERLLYSQ